jgi:pimeloyl-ACP methyl ester carboxylesterase
VAAVCIGAANAACRAQASITSQASIAWEPFVGVAFDGSPMSGELGRIEVPENRERDTGATIRLAFVRYRTTNPNPGPPIFFLPGGPGASSTEYCAAYASHPQIRLLEHSDVIGIDQRGTGLSEPNLLEPEFVRILPPHRAIDRADVRHTGRGSGLICRRTTRRRAPRMWKRSGARWASRRSS